MDFQSFKFQNNYNFSNLNNVPGVLEYPHLGTYMWALFWSGSIIDNEYTGRIFYTFMYLMSFFIATSKIILDEIKKSYFINNIDNLSFDKILFSGYQEPIMFCLCILFLFLVEKIAEKRF